MSNVKERIFGAVTVMNEQDAAALWNIIIETFSDWNNIPEIQPDDDDLKMLDGIEKDPDCKSFVSSADAMKQLNLM